MGTTVTVTGMILKAAPLKEYDRRVELLTLERGRISAFAKGARKAGSALSACTIPFTFGKFVLYEGRSSYTIQSAEIQKYFGDIAQDYDMTCYASYFAEMAQYVTRENMEAVDEMILLYTTFLALQSGKLPFSLIRIIYEMRLLMIEGQGLELFECLHCHNTDTRSVYFAAGGLVCDKCAAKEKELADSYPFILQKDVLYSFQYILTAPVEKLYSFLVTDEVQKEMERFMRAYKGRYLTHQFKSEAFLA